MTDVTRPPIAPINAPKKPKPTVRTHSDKRAPFLPDDDHPHGWIARHEMKTE